MEDPLAESFRVFDLTLFGRPAPAWRLLRSCPVLYLCDSVSPAAALLAARCLAAWGRDGRSRCMLLALRIVNAGAAASPRCLAL